MDFLVYLRFVVVLAFVLGLIWLAYWAMRKYGVERLGLAGGGPGSLTRLAIVEAKMLDTRRRLVLVRRDNVEHLLLLGTSGDVVIERGIGAAGPGDTGFSRMLADRGGLETGNGETSDVGNREGEEQK